MIFEVGPDHRDLSHAPACHARPRHGGRAGRLRLAWKAALSARATADCGRTPRPRQKHRPIRISWLDPENAVAMTDAIAAALSKADPAHAALSCRATGARVRAAQGAGGGAHRQARAVARPAVPRLPRRLSVFRAALRAFLRRRGDRRTRQACGTPARLDAARRRSARAASPASSASTQFPPALIQTLVEGSTRARRRAGPAGRGACAGAGALSQAARQPRRVTAILSELNRRPPISSKERNDAKFLRNEPGRGGAARGLEFRLCRSDRIR